MSSLAKDEQGTVIEPEGKNEAESSSNEDLMSHYVKRIATWVSRRSL